MTTIELKDDAPVVRIKEKDRPKDWDSVPYKRNLAGHIQQIIDSKSYVAALVPSIHSPVESNVLLLPDHPKFDDYVKWISDDAINFDLRLK